MTVTTEKTDGVFIMKIDGEDVVKFVPSIVTSIFVVNKFIDTKLCFALCNVGESNRFKKTSRCGVTRYCENEAVLTVDDGRTRTGAFDSATTMTVLYEPGRLADIKIFPASVHICGLRDLNECLVMLKFILKYFESTQRQLDEIYGPSPDDELRKEFFERYRTNYPEDESFTAFQATIDASHKCNTIPVVIHSKDIVMTNYKGEFNTLINIRFLYQRLQNYPGLISNLSTMSNSNALNVIILEIEPFYPIKHSSELTEDQIF